MLFLIALIIAVFIAFFLDKPLKKHPSVFYVTAAVMTAVSIIILQSDIEISSRFVRDYVIGIFSRGALGGAFWAVVMWTGALPNGTAPIKKLMPIRGELSITAAIITLSHIITYGLQYISSFLNDRTGSDFAVTSVVCIVMVLIMIPLTVMSFKTIRKKMNAKTWKKIQRLAYIFYALIYVHILVLFVPKAQKGREGYFLSVLVYSLVFIGYAVMRIRKAYIAKKKSETKVLPNLVCACAMIVPVSLAGAVSRSKNEPAKIVSESEESSVVFTFTNEVTTQPETSVTRMTTKKTDSKSAITTSETTTTSAVSTTETAESTDEKSEEETSAEEQHDEPAQDQHEEPQQEAEPQVTYRYRNGEYEGEAEGYAGKVHVKLTIENDTITSISAWADEDDSEYFGDAMNTVIPQIASKVGTDGVDACSGATYSSKGIIEAARKALEQAMN